MHANTIIANRHMWKSDLTHVRTLFLRKKIWQEKGKRASGHQVLPNSFSGEGWIKEADNGLLPKAESFIHWNSLTYGTLIP